MKKTLKLIFVVFLMLSLFAGSFFLAFSFLPNSTNPESVDFTVTEGEGVEEISQNLKKVGIIRSALSFEILTRSIGTADNLQAGIYYLERNKSPYQTSIILQHGVLDVKLTFIEGWRREEYQEYLKAQSSRLRQGSGGQVNLKNENIVEEFGYLSQGMEGKLFPDTYFVLPNVTAEELIELFSLNYEKKVSPLFLSSDNQNFLTEEEALIFASIVEREAKFDEDRPIIAGILLKRYENGWPLEADATVQYAVGREGDWWPKELTSYDISVDSLYNTRRNVGLPPTPICNPGLTSIKAVLSPEELGYWYYFSDSKGKMYYAKTLEKHTENIVKFSD